VVVSGVLIDLDAVQVEFLLVPAADDVEPGSSMGDVIDGRNRLGSERRRHQRHVDGREYANVPGQGSDGCAVRHGLERLAVDVGLALVAAPLRDRQDEFHAGSIGDLAHGDDVVPVSGPALGRQAHREAAIAIGAEYAELELVGTPHWIGRRRLRHGLLV
jgi:hypothetical protein